MSAPRLPDGYVLHAFDRVGSTNDEAKRLAEAGAASGQVVVAREQTRGRGRYGRTWASPPGNLYASVLLRPHCVLAETAQLSLVAGLALAEALERLGPPGLELALKWPNDVLIRGAKTAGILLESGPSAGDGGLWVVIGSGVNIASHPEGVPYPATALARENFAADLEPLAVLESYLAALDAWLARWRSGGFADVCSAWRARSWRLGEEIRLRLAREELRGRFVDLTSTGALLLEGIDGVRRELGAGDVLDAGR